MLLRSGIRSNCPVWAGLAARARVAQGVARPSRAAAAARRSPGSPRRPRSGRRGGAAMPRETFTRRPPPGRPPAGRGGRRTVAQDRLDRRHPGRRCPGRGSRDRAPRPGSRRAPRAPSRRPRARPFRPGPRSRHAGRPGGGAALGRRADRRVGRDDEVLELGRARGSRSGTGRRRSGRPARGAARSPPRPRYGLTVTASAPSPSKSATAWRAAVEPMSARLASMTTGMSAGIRARIRSRAASPADAERLVEGEVRLDRGGIRAGRLDEQHGERSTPATSGENPAGSRRRVRVEAEAQDAADRRGPRGQPFEVGRGHCGADEPPSDGLRGGRGRRGRGRVRAAGPAGRTSRAGTHRRARRPRSGR